MCLGRFSVDMVIMRHEDIARGLMTPQSVAKKTKPAGVISFSGYLVQPVGNSIAMFEIYLVDI